MSRFTTRICEHCAKTFKIETRKLLYDDNIGIRKRGIFCSYACHINHRVKTKNVDVICTQCGNKFTKKICNLSQTNNNFCTQSCAATYNNTHKTKGNRRSRLEKFVEQRIKETFPLLEYEANKKSIGSELDFYFPKLNFAIEINGIFHYEPIYGIEKFAQIQANDKLKLKQCEDKNITLIIHKDTIKYFNSKTSEHAWLEIKQIIEMHL